MKILTLADIHVKTNSDINFWKYLIDKQYEEAVAKSPDLIVVLGDIFHNKTTLSPQQVSIVSYFLKKLSDISDVIIIKGNHDISLQNMKKMDSITPIVNLLNKQSLKHKLIYLNKSQVYEYNDTHNFIVYDFSDADNYITNLSTINGIKIGLFHGIPYKSKINGIELSENIDNKLFEGLDYLFCGDQHIVQYFNADKTFFMNGSFYQQSFGETEDGHGYHIVDTDSKEVTFYELHNDYYGYVTLTDSDFKITDDKVKLLKKVNYTHDFKLRTDLRNEYTTEQLTNIRKEIKSKLGKDIIITVYTDPIKHIQEFSTLNLSDPKVQNELIRKYCEENKIGNVEKLIEINNKINAEIKENQNTYFIRWTPLELKFKNMFSYGEDENVIDFRRLNGVTSIMGNNFVGKSSLLNVMLFALYDKCTSVEKKEQVINDRKDNTFVQFTLQVEDEVYRISKELIRKKSKVSSSVSFEKLNKKTNEFEVTENTVGDTKADTKKIINNILGDYNDVLKSTFSTQDESSSLFKLGESERRDFVYNFIGVSIFEGLYTASSRYENEHNGKIKQYNKVNFDEDIETNEINKKTYTENIITYKNDIINIENNIKSTDEKIIAENNKLTILKEKTKDSSDLAKYKAEIVSLQSDNLTLETMITSQKNNLNIKQNRLNDLNKIDIKAEIKKIEDEKANDTRIILENNTHIDNFKKIKAELEVKEEKNKEIKSKLDILNSKLKEIEINNKNFERQTGILSNQSWMRTNDLCRTCQLAKDAFSADESLTKNKELVEKTNLVYNKLKEQYNENISVEIKNNNVEIEKLNNDINTLKRLILDKDSKILNINKITSDIENLSTEITHLQSAIVLNKEKIDNNTTKINEKELKLTELGKIDKYIKEQLEVEQTIVMLNTDKENYKRKITSHNNEINILSTAIGSCDSTIVNLKANKKEYDEALTEYMAYKTYREIVHRNGLPFTTLKNYIPKLNSKIEEYISDLVPFKLYFKIEDDKLRICVSKHEGIERDIKSTSGMEKTISAWAIRLALSEYSILPKSDMIVIDEGFGAFDNTQISIIQSLFTKIKSKFSKVFVISHVPIINDFVDNIINIDKDDDDYSYIRVE